jgi:uncharacterized protein
MLLTCIIIGLLSGVVAALCGVGGGVIMVPAFVWLLKIEQKEAAATSLAVIFLTAVVASFKNHANQLVIWKVVLPTAIASAVGAWLGADYLKLLSNQTLTRIFAIVMIGVGFRMLLSR